MIFMLISYRRIKIQESILDHLFRNVFRNGISQACYIVEMHHSDPESSILLEVGTVQASLFSTLTDNT